MIERDLKYRVREALCISVEAGVFLLAMIVIVVVIVLIGIAGYAGLKAFAGMMGVC